MNNIDMFIEWYIGQINPRTGRHYAKRSARTFVVFINRLVRAGLVGENILDVGAAQFMRQINRAQNQHPAEFAALENHGNLKNGIKWWKSFLDARANW